MIDDTLYDAFGQRQVSTMYTPLNQYHVVMEVAPKYWQNPASLIADLTCGSANSSRSPLSTFTHYAPGTTALSVNHQGQFPSVTISFNLAPGVSLGQAVDAIDAGRSGAWACRASIHGSFAGTAQAFQASLANEPMLVLAALVAVYIVLGMLVRELHSSDHDSFDAAVGRRRSAAGADALPASI